MMADLRAWHMKAHGTRSGTWLWTAGWSEAHCTSGMQCIRNADTHRLWCHRPSDPLSAWTHAMCVVAVVCEAAWHCSSSGASADSQLGTLCGQTTQQVMHAHTWAGPGRMHAALNDRRHAPLLSCVTLLWSCVQREPPQAQQTREEEGRSRCRQEKEMRTPNTTETTSHPSFPCTPLLAATWCRQLHASSMPASLFI